MLLSHHSPFRKAVHGWSCYELREKGDIFVGDSHSYAVRRGVGTIRRGDRDKDGADIVHRSRSEGLHLRLGAGRIPTAMNDGIADTLIGGVGQNGVGIHEPAQFKHTEATRMYQRAHTSSLHTS